MSRTEYAILGMFVAVSVVRLARLTWTAIRNLRRKRGEVEYIKITGVVEDFDPAFNRPGCVLKLKSGDIIGKYYVPLSPHDCRREFPSGRTATLQIERDPRPVDGIIDTAGNGLRLWDVIR